MSSRRRHLHCKKGHCKKSQLTLAKITEKTIQGKTTVRRKRELQSQMSLGFSVGLQRGFPFSELNPGIFSVGTSRRSRGRGTEVDVVTATATGTVAYMPSNSILGFQSFMSKTKRYIDIIAGFLVLTHLGPCSSFLFFVLIRFWIIF